MPIKSSNSNTLIKSISEAYVNDKTQNSYVTIMLGAFGWPRVTGTNKSSVNMYTNEKMLFVLAELRTTGKPILWDISLSQIYKLKNQEWFKCLNKIENGDAVSICYDSNIHDDFMILIDIIKQFRLEKIFIKFSQKLDFDIIKIVNHATRTDIYYDASDKYVDKSKFIRFED